jgi:hypothetical protein
VPQLDEWAVDNDAVWLKRVGDQTVALRHPTYPAEKIWPDENPDTLKGIVAEYLLKVREVLRLPSLSNSGEFEDAPLVLLPLRLDTDESTDPRASFSITRYDDPDRPSADPIDQTVVFLAVEAAKKNTVDAVLGSRLGIRAVVHIHKPAQSADKIVRITGAARSTDLSRAVGTRSLAIEAFLNYFFTPRLFDELKNSIRAAAGLADNAPLWIDGVRLPHVSEEQPLIEVYANLPRPLDDPDALAYALTARLVFDPENPPGTVTVERFPLMAHAGPVKAQLFTRDPASKAGPAGVVDARPNRSPERLAGFRDEVTLTRISLDGTGRTTLHDDGDMVEITKSKLVDKQANETEAGVEQPAAVTNARTNSFAALSGYERARASFNQHHGRPLFETMVSFGLSPLQYFRFASCPLLVRYRARITPGPGKDGKTINAQVDFDPPNSDLVGPAATWASSNRKPLQVRFALADLKRSASRRQPLGLAADPRWSWHEYCHVLLAARTGALEFHFAHSAGDALAAITNDPWSELATDPWLRGCTFPWVYIHRRHDRSVYDGWSWSGRYHRPPRFVPYPSDRRHKGYQSEQILSTSLFRLYQALGGETVDAGGAPDRPARERAADFTVYLILRAIGLLPPAFLNVVETPDQLVSTLIDADVGTWPASAGPLQGRAGGWAHKVVRWAFEAQGLYATTNPWEVVHAPGKPPPVDIFIENRRPDSEGDYRRGGYMPVSLDWHAATGPSAWQASDSAIQVNGSNQVAVEVRNRGALDAVGVTVEVWWIEWPAAQLDPPVWDRSSWHSLGPSAPWRVPPWPAPAVSFGPFPLPAPAGTRVLILAAAQCAADPTNIETTTGLPCALVPAPVIDLVAGDNNLGLRLYMVP